MAVEHALPSLLGALFTFSLAAFIYVKNRELLMDRLFMLFLACISIQGFGEAMLFIVNTSKEALFWDMFSITGGILAIPLLIHFMYEYFMDKHTNLKVLQYYLIAIGFFIANLLGLFFTDMKPIPEGFVGIAGPAYYIFTWYLVIIMVFIFLRYLRGLFRTDSIIERRRIEYVLASISILFIGALIDLLRNLDIVTLLPFPIIRFTIIIFSFIIFMTIIKYKLLHIKVIIRKSFKFTFISIVIALVFEIIKTLLNIGLDNFFHISSPVTSVIAAVAVAFSFEPIKKKTEKISNKIF